MSDFADVERFAREHAACGGLTPTAMPKPGGGGYLLTLTCTCGATFDRWVSPEEARRPLPIPARAAPARAPAAPAAPAAPPAARRPRRRRLPRPARPRRRSPSHGPARSWRRWCARPWPPRRRAPPAAAPAPATPPAPVEPAARGRVAPERLNLDTTIRSALQHQADLALPPPRARRGSRGRLVWLVLFMIVGLGAAGVIFVAGGPDGPLPLGTTSSAPPPRTNDPQRAALEGIVKSLRELHAVATSTTSVSVYSTRVTSAKTEAERYLAASAPGASRTRVREALDIHLLAVSAWRAKSLDQREAWEAVGLDPSIDLCPPLRLVADFTAQPESVSRAQARGAAVAGALPLLWECANERIAALEQTLAGR